MKMNWYQKVEKRLFSVPKLRAKIERLTAKLEVDDCKGIDYSTPRVQSSNSKDSTADIVLQKIIDTKQLQQAKLELIEILGTVGSDEFTGILSADDRRLVEIWYFGPERLTVAQKADVLGVDKNTLYRRRAKIIEELADEWGYERDN